MEQTKKNNPAPPVSAVAQMVLAELQTTMISPSRLEISEYELELILGASLKRETIHQGGELSDEIFTTHLASIAQVLYGQSAQSGIFLQGNFGCGKTTLLKSAAEALRMAIDPFSTGFMDETSKICEVSMVDLLLHHDENIVDDILNADYLFIDDVGWECNFEDSPRIKEVQTIVAAAIQKRYDEKMPTMLATVFDPINFGDIYGDFTLDVIEKGYSIVELEHDFYKTRKV